MSEWDPQTWSRLAQALYGLGALYLLGFFIFFSRFLVAEKHARTGDAAAVRRYNRMLRGFPNSFYAKMLGKRRLETQLMGDRGGGAPP